MTIRELGDFFKEHLVPKKLYKLGGEKGMRICLEKTENGWEVYFCDKHHSKVGLIKAADENSACDVMKNEVRKVMESLYGVTWAA